MFHIESNNPIEYLTVPIPGFSSHLTSGGNFNQVDSAVKALGLYVNKSRTEGGITVAKQEEALAALNEIEATFSQRCF